MKTPGRVGPAALIGIGTHVIPIDGSDSDGTTVAAVTSGTGEHIAATMAARVSAEYMYHSGRDGTGDEHEAIQNVVNHKFMRHPAVLRSFTGASLGVMTIKKSRNSIKFYFAHNTASFALASYTSVDRRPRTVMSRKIEGRNVAIGAKVWLYGTQPNADTTA